MRIIYSYLLLFLFLLTWELRSQNLSAYSQNFLNRANTAAGLRFLTEEEKQAVLLVNLARMDGPAFIRNVLNPFVQERNPDQNEYLSSLIRDLQALPALPPLIIKEELCSSAKYHARDMGAVGKTGHDSSDGTRCFDRIRGFYSGGAMAENCSYGFGDAAGIVMQLLIDDRVPSLGHRKNILNSVYRRFGLGINTHAVYRYNCVMDFSD